MIKYATILTVLLTGCATTHIPYVTVGAGYKVDEKNFINLTTNERVNEPISARIEVGVEAGAIKYGVSHHSQWFSGFPFNNDSEYFKTEIFIDYTWKWDSR